MPDRLAPEVYAQGHGLPDRCEEHGDLPKNQSMADHVQRVHGLTYSQWITLEEIDLQNGFEPYDPHLEHDCDAMNAARDKPVKVVNLEEFREAAADAHSGWYLYEMERSGKSEHASDWSLCQKSICMRRLAIASM